MGEFIAYVGLFVFLGGLVGMVSPRLLRLRRRVHALAVAAAGFFLIGLGASREPADTDVANSVAVFTEITPASRITGSGCAGRLVDDGEPVTLNVGSRVPIGACAQRGDDGGWEPVQATVSHENVDGAVEIAGREDFSAAAPDAVLLRGVSPGLVQITVRMGALEGSAPIRIIEDF